MQQQPLAVTVQEADAIQCLRDFFRKLDGATSDDQSKGQDKGKLPASLRTVRNLPITTLTETIKPPF